MKSRYKIIVESDDNGWVKVSIPAFPEVLTEAHTKEQAIYFAQKAAESIIASSIESGKSIPPSDIDAIVIEH